MKIPRGRGWQKKKKFSGGVGGGMEVQTKKASVGKVHVWRFSGTAQYN